MQRSGVYPQVPIALKKTVRPEPHFRLFSAADRSFKGEQVWIRIWFWQDDKQTIAERLSYHLTIVSSKSDRQYWYLLAVKNCDPQLKIVEMHSTARTIFSSILSWNYNIFAIPIFRKIRVLKRNMRIAVSTLLFVHTSIQQNKFTRQQILQFALNSFRMNCEFFFVTPCFYPKF